MTAPATTTPTLTVIERRVLDAVSRAARAGELCPSNNDLADIVGMASPAVGSETLSRLEERGFVRVERFQAARRVTILATAERTAMPANCRPHWRTTPPPPGHPTGAELVEQIAAAAAERGMPLNRFAQPLHPENIQSWLRALGQANRPKPETIARVRALIAGEQIPPPPSPKARAAIRSGPMGDPRVSGVTVRDREPCFRCGTRADVGCRHRPASQEETIQ